MVELLGKPLTFGDPEQIAAIRKMEKEAEEKELRKKYGCTECNKTGTATVECDQCDGTGEMEADCEECDGTGYNEPEAKL